MQYQERREKAENCDEKHKSGYFVDDETDFGVNTCSLWWREMSPKERGDIIAQIIDDDDNNDDDVDRRMSIIASWRTFYRRY